MGYFGWILCSLTKNGDGKIDSNPVKIIIFFRFIDNINRRVYFPLTETNNDNLRDVMSNWIFCFRLY